MGSPAWVWVGVGNDSDELCHGATFVADRTYGYNNPVRVMGPNDQYSHGYVRFYNEDGQPAGLDGKPGPNSVTHIPRNPDGTYPTPKGWDQ
ncbi:MAG: hypothetical protein JWN95_1795 [Frankiales bacterium]|nr:hypothetical protein [Frankiales bacterium]